MFLAFRVRIFVFTIYTVHLCRVSGAWVWFACFSARGSGWVGRIVFCVCAQNATGAAGAACEGELGAPGRGGARVTTGHNANVM